MTSSSPSHSRRNSDVAGIRLLLALTLTVALGARGSSQTAQPRPLTAADLPKASPQLPADIAALRGLTGKTLVERLLLASDSGATLRLALGITSPEFQKGVRVEELIAQLSALRAESMKELMPALLAPLEPRERAQALDDPQPRAAGLMASALRGETVTWPLPAPSNVIGRGDTAALAHGAGARSAVEWPADTQTYTAVNEYEFVVEGMTANVREEITMLFEGRHVGLRHLKRETVERNDDPAAVGRYVVERGIIDPAAGTIPEKPHARRLRPTSTHRVTTETLREGKVERCPDATGISHGQTLFSLTIRATAGASGNGSPSFIESASRGTSMGRVNDSATLVGFDFDARSDTRMEALNAGENFRLSDTMRVVNMKAADTPGVTIGEPTVSGVGTNEMARKFASAHIGMGMQGVAELLLAYDTAEKDWRRGACVELTVTSGAEPKELAPGESRRVVVDARHRYEPQPPAIPVTAEPGGGTVTPGAPVRTPAAAITFKADAGGDGGGTVSFNSVSRRGIARDISVLFDPVDDDAILLRHVFTGFKFVESTAEDCPSMRPNGQEVLTARLRLLRSRDGTTYYGGTGRFSADIDGCGLTPDRKDPGGTGNGNGFGGFNGDNFIGCKVTTVAAEREVLVTVAVEVLEDLKQIRSVEISWEPSGTATDPRVTSTCEPPWHAEHVKNLTGEYRRENRVEITDPDLLGRMVAGTALRPGTYDEPDASSDGSWRLTLTKVASR